MGWPQDDIIDFMEEARLQLFEKRKLKRDSMIMVYCGHGGNGTIISSDGKEFSINQLHDKFGGAWKSKVTQIPRLFIMDCCRGDRPSGAVNKKRSTGAHTSERVF